MLKTSLLAVVCLVGCAAEARLPASYFAEGGTVLAPGQVAITGVAGGGATTDGTAVGAGGRIRVGIGDGQEIGIEAAGIEMTSPGNHCAFDCGDYSPTWSTIRGRSALLSYKYQLRPELAVILGAGMSEHRNAGGDPMPDADDHGRSIDASAAVVRSMRLSQDVDFYAGVRAAAATPTGPNNSAKASSLLGVSSALGLDIRLAGQLHAYLEAGPRSTLIFNDGLTVGLSAVGGLGLVL